MTLKENTLCLSEQKVQKNTINYIIFNLNKIQLDTINIFKKINQDYKFFLLQFNTIQKHSK